MINELGYDLLKSIEDSYKIFDGQDFSYYGKKYSLLCAKETKDKGSRKIALELPGFTQEEISIDAKDTVLYVTAKHTEKGDYLRQSFSTEFSLVKKDDCEKITAALKNGVLTITIPEKAEPEPKKVKISIG